MLMLRSLLRLPASRGRPLASDCLAATGAGAELKAPGSFESGGRAFSSAADVHDKLSSLQLKELLDAQGIDYRDCFERTDLLKRARETIPQHLLESKALEDSPVFSAQKHLSSRGLFLDEENTVSLFQRCSPSVVNIKTGKLVRSNALDMNTMEVPAGHGSGIIWDAEGHVVTNYHVVSGASSSKVVLSSGAVYDAKLVASEPNKDISVLKIDRLDEALTPIQIGQSHNLLVGQKVFAIGNPFGLDRSLSAGIISAVDRDFQSVTGRAIKNVIQSDAAINPGNSGGALLDSKGKLVGVNTAIFSRSGTFGGIGFAIPVDTVRRIASQIIRNGRVSRAGLGILCASDSLARAMGVKTGVVVAVDRSSRLQGTQIDYSTGRTIPGDTIIGINDMKVEIMEDLMSLIDEKFPGARIKLTIIPRDDRRTRKTVDWELVELPPDAGQA